jgi:hypothetical protein
VLTKLFPPPRSKHDDLGSIPKAIHLCTCHTVPVKVVEEESKPSEPFDEDAYLAGQVIFLGGNEAAPKRGKYMYYVISSATCTHNNHTWKK